MDVRERARKSEKQRIGWSVCVCLPDRDRRTETEINRQTDTERQSDGQTDTDRPINKTGRQTDKTDRKRDRKSARLSFRE